MENNEKKRKKPAKSTPKKSTVKKPTAKKTSAKKPTAKKSVQAKKTPAKKPTTKKSFQAKKTPTKKSTVREPQIPKKLLEELDAAEKRALQARAEQARKTNKKPAPSSSSCKRTVEVPEGAKITDIRVHYKF